MKIKTLFICMLILGLDANAKLSSNKIEKQKDKIQNIIDVCKFDDSVLKEIKGKTTGSIVTSSIATAASGVSTGTSIRALAKTKGISTDASENKNKDKNIDNAKLKNLRVASAIGSGIATGANLVTVTLSGPSLKKIKEQIEISEDCKEAIAELDKNALMSTK